MNLNVDLSKFVAISVTDKDNPYLIGVRVKVARDYPGMRNILGDTCGTVLMMLRDREANERYARTKDVDWLMDSEGPLVQFDNGEIEAFIGQAISCICPIPKEH